MSLEKASIRPSGGGNGGRRISVVHCLVGFLHPVAHRIAPAGSHRYSFLLQMDPPELSSDLTSAPKKSPEARRRIWLMFSFVYVVNCTFTVTNLFSFIISINFYDPIVKKALLRPHL